jgi:hypothetical protein
VGCCLTLLRLFGLLPLGPLRHPAGDCAHVGPLRLTGGTLALVAGAELMLAALLVSALTPIGAGVHQHHHPGATAGTGLLLPSSHLLLMVQVELLTVVVPLLVVTVLPRRRPALPVDPSRPALAVAGLLALGYPAVIIGWHVPAVHGLFGGAHGGTLALVRAASLLLAGLAFWAFARGAGPALPATARTALTVLALEIAALPGLVLLLAVTPLYGAGPGAAGLSALTDQRLAGALMMLVDLPLAVALGRRTPAPAGLPSQHAVASR